MQAIKANAAALAPRRRSDSQASSKTITSPRNKAEERKLQGRSSPSMDVMMHRTSHQDLHRLDSMCASGSFADQREDISGSYNHNVFPMYWSGQEDSSSLGSAPPQTSPASGYHHQQFWDETAPVQSGTSYYEQIPHSTAFSLPYGYDSHQVNSLGLKGDTGLSVGLSGELNLGEGVRREQKPFDVADGLDLVENLNFKADSGADNDSYEDSTDSDLPPEKKKLSAAFRPRGRKKRNKCTPDQLRNLETFFEKNRNPTGRIRHELSKKLRMPERSVQVWFQNRRAKVKTVERRGDTGSDSGRKKSYSIRLSDKDTYRPIGASGRASRDAADQVPSVTAIPTSALCIGSWRRVSPLICFFSRRLQSMTWYLTSESIGFKLEIPWTSIRSAYFDGPSSPSVAERAEGVRVPLGHFVIDLERPPTFFMEVFRSAPVKNGITEEPKVSWRQCEDFTEDHQAMNVSRHILNGPYEELRNAVQALAQCNDVLGRLIEFRDTHRRANGAIPTGSGSTADNFGLVNNLGMQSADPYTSPVDGSAALAGTDMYGNTVQMPFQSTAMSSSSSLQKRAAWHNFRTPLRSGTEYPWDFDSPASVSTNLSEASLDSSQRHPLGYSPYGVASSIEASPRSGLGSSMDLGALRIDTGGISSFAPSSVPMGVGTGYDSGRGSFQGWDGQLAYDMTQVHPDAQYSLSAPGNVGGGQTSAQAMQAQGMDTSFGAGQLQHFDRNGGDRQSYATYATVTHSNGQNQGDGSISETSRSHQSDRGLYNSPNGPHEHDSGTSSSELLSRSSSIDGSAHPEYRHKVEYDGPTSAAMTRHSQDQQSSAAHLAPPFTGSATRFTSLDEDAFCGQTPTHRTTFGSSVHPRHVTQTSNSCHDQSSSSGGHRSEPNGRERYTGSSLAPPPSIEYECESDGENPVQGRARANTYRPSTHGGAASSASSSASMPQSASSNDRHRAPWSGDEARAVSASGSDGAHHPSSVGKDDGTSSPGILSLSSEMTDQRERDLSSRSDERPSDELAEHASDSSSSR